MCLNVYTRVCVCVHVNLSISLSHCASTYYNFCTACGFNYSIDSLIHSGTKILRSCLLHCSEAGGKEKDREGQINKMCESRHAVAWLSNVVEQSITPWLKNSILQRRPMPPLHCVSVKCSVPHPPRRPRPCVIVVMVTSPLCCRMQAAG